MSLKRRLEKLEGVARKAAEAAPAGMFPWFSPRVYELFACTTPEQFAAMELSDRERAELDEWMRTKADQPGCLRVMAELERVEALAAEGRDPHDEG